MTTKTTDTPGNVIGRTRDRRSNYVKFVNFDCAEVPDSPNPNTLRYIKLKLVDEEQIIKMKNVRISQIKLLHGCHFHSINNKCLIVVI